MRLARGIRRPNPKSGVMLFGSRRFYVKRYRGIGSSSVLVVFPHGWARFYYRGEPSTPAIPPQTEGA